MHRIMKIGIDILGVDAPEKIINFINTYKDNEVELYVYGMEKNYQRLLRQKML